MHRDIDHNSMFNNKRKSKVCHQQNDKYSDNIMSWESRKKGERDS